MKIAVGTTSKQKIQFLKEVLDELGLTCSIEPLNVSSGVSDQPFSSKETKLGSLNRAKTALSLSSKADYSIGIEVGYQPNKVGDYKMFCWASLIDKRGKKISAKSHQLLLPKFHQQILKENKYLGEYVRQYLVKNTDPISQQVGIIIRDRKPLIKTAVRLVLFNYFVK